MNGETIHNQTKFFCLRQPSTTPQAASAPLQGSSCSGQSGKSGVNAVCTERAQQQPQQQQQPPPQQQQQPQQAVDNLPWIRFCFCNMSLS